MAKDNGKIIYKNGHMKVTVRKTTRREKVSCLIGIAVVLLVWWLLAKYGTKTWQYQNHRNNATEEDLKELQALILNA